MRVLRLGAAARPVFCGPSRALKRGAHNRGRVFGYDGTLVFVVPPFYGGSVPIDLLSERARKVAGVAQRLRLVQAELLDHPAEERRAHLRDEIELILRAMVPGERKQFLFELVDEFPVFGDSQVSDVAPASSGPDRATLDALAAAQAEVATLRTELSRFNDVGMVSDRLIELSKRQNEEQRKTLVKKLATAGLAAVKTVEVNRAESAPTPLAPPPQPVAAPAPAAPVAAQNATVGGDLRKAAGLTDADQVDSARAGELAAVLTEFSGGLDELVWTAWRQVIAPGSKISRPGPLKRTFGQFLKNESGVSRQRVADDVALLRLITAATIAATSRAGKNFARKHLTKFGVDAIKAAVGAGGWGSKEAKYWAKYEELANVLNEDSIDAEIMQCIGEAARGLAEGKAGSRPA